jgi:integrase
MRPRENAAGFGLLNRMEARPRKDGLTTYRYKPLVGPAINLGTDKAAAIRRVLDLNNEAPNRGTMSHLWAIYAEPKSTDWMALSESTRDDYTQSWQQVKKVFGQASPKEITPPVCARYLRVERKAAPVRANREMALISNLMNVAVERGDIAANPCKQVRRNKERPRTIAPATQDLGAFLHWAWALGGQARIIACMAEFAALAGNRRVEFLNARWTQVGETEIRLIRGKQRGDKQIVEVIAIGPSMIPLLTKMRALATNDRLGALFPNRFGNPYTSSGFKATWCKLRDRAVAEKVIAQRFTFHDLRAYYVTQHKGERGSLPDLHANPGTTARIYDRSKEVKRVSF